LRNEYSSSQMSCPIQLCFHATSCTEQCCKGLKRGRRTLGRTII
jgi:hypothetical protein